MSIFRVKPIEALMSETAGGEHSLKRVLGAGDLIMLAIGAVIGAGIFGSIGSAAAGQIGPNGEVIRLGAGPALVLSFVLLGACCALAGLCYAELASMIPQAGSAYAYSYATLGELVAWIIGWDLILEYAVGNVAVAISWGDYFKSLLSGWITMPEWLTTGYRTALLSSDPAVHGMLDRAPHIGGMPILINVPAFGIVMFITWLLLRGAKESTRANNLMVAVKLLVLGVFIIGGLTHINTANYVPFAPNGFTGIHQGAAIVFFAYIGFDAISTAAEETKNPQRNLPIGILGGLAICTVIYIVIGAVLTGMVPAANLGKSADPLAYALTATGMQGLAKVVALGAIFSMAAVLLVFQYGQPRIFFAMGRDGLLPKWIAKVDRKTRIPYTATLVTGVFVALWSLIGDAAETYDLTNIGTLFAFILVCAGVLFLRVNDPARPRPFRIPTFVLWIVAPLGAVLCAFVMQGLPAQAWERFLWWLVIGGAVYAFYGRSHSKLVGSNLSGSELISFKGRATRSTYWLMSITVSLGGYVMGAMSFSLFSKGIHWSTQVLAGLIVVVWGLLSLAVSLSVQVRRWQDRGRPGWMVFVALVPQIALVLILWDASRAGMAQNALSIAIAAVGTLWVAVELGCLRGTRGDNAFGHDPNSPQPE